MFVALRETITEFDIPEEPFADLISAFEQDQTCTRYETFDELRDYCRRSADPVGRLVLYLLREANDENFGFSDSICTGLQLANFWQDVEVDLRKDRIYIPRDEMDDAGVSEEDLRAGLPSDAFRALINDQWLGRFLPFPACFVAELDGRLIGYVQGDISGPHPILDEPPKARIGNLWVEPEHRRKGIARDLVNTYVSAANAAGFPWVEVGTLTKDARAVAFWRALGFGDWRVSLLRS